MPQLKNSMRAAASVAAAFAMALTVLGADESRDDLLRLFNSRLAENPKRFATAARRVAKGAEKGLVLNQFAIAIVADDAFFPADLRASIPDGTMESYFANRTKIEFAAKNKRNAFAWYLLSLAATNDTERVECLGKAVSANNDQALNELGVHMINVARADLARALEDLRRRQESNSDEEEVEVARREAESKRLALESAQRHAAGYFRRAADKSDSNGCYNFGAALYYGYGVKQDRMRAMEFLKQAAKDGQPQAMSLLGECYRNGVAGTPDLTAALASFKQSADLGNASGQLNYGLAVLRGEGVEANPAAALPLLKAAADKRLAEGMFEYGKCLLEGVGFEEKSENGLVGDELARVRAENADARARRQREAAAWFYHCAVDHHYSPAMERLATCLFEGLGVEKDERLAVYWYHRAAIGYDDIPSMRRLAQCAELGLGGVRKSHEDALWWLTKAKAAEGVRCARVWLAQHKPHRFDRLRQLTGGSR